MIGEELSNKTIVITGATGFLGTALVERLLRCAPGSKLVCLVRPTRRANALQRIHREVIGNDCFDRLREELGSKFQDEVDTRISAIAGDVAQDALGLDEAGFQVLAGADVVIHSAATVSFESPLDVAIEVNLLGPTRVAEAMHLAKSSAHLVAVSTAYVAGSRRGDAREELVTEAWYSPDCDWKREVSVAREMRNDAEKESRSLASLARFRRKARAEMGPASTPLLAERAEKYRIDWVNDQMVALGKARAASLGWPDVYAYSKALAERALLENRGDIPVTFVRPSIIESALHEPVPGWIRGFRMAEPVLLGVGKGLLKQFPGFPEGVLDVIPVDKVVACLCAVAASDPPRDPQVYQIASGTRQPLRYRNLVELVTEWFRENPLYDANGEPILIEEWKYPERRSVERTLQRTTMLMEYSEKALRFAPFRHAAGKALARLHTQQAGVLRAKGYVDIYAAYTESEARFRIERTLELYGLLTKEDQKTFNFDPIDIDWRRYLHEIHLPSVVTQGRVRTKPSKRTPVDRAARARANVLSDKRELAVFDLDHTLVPPTVLSSYFWLAMRHLSLADRGRLLALKLPQVPDLLLADRRDRSEFQRRFYRWFNGAPIAQLEADAEEYFATALMPQLFPAALTRLQAHREAGHRLVLMTGALEIVAKGFAPLFDDVIATELGHDENGLCTGEIIGSPPVGEARALRLRDYAEEHKIQLSETVAYADSTPDLPLLEAVGHAVAVNPQPQLSTIAHRRGWLVEHWGRAPRAPRPFFPPLFKE